MDNEKETHQEEEIMPKFTRKPIPVDAVQFRIDAPIADWPEGVEMCLVKAEPFLDTKDGVVFYLDDGDWIITLPDGSTIITHDEDFQKKYDKVKE